MPNHSNAITDALKHEELGRDGSYSCAAHQEGLHCCTDPEHPDFSKLTQALYEAVKGCVPEAVEPDEKNGFHEFREGHNKAVQTVLTNLSLLFGISKEGDTDV